MSAPAAGVWPRLGAGIGIRTVHYEEILEQGCSADWFEAITENFLGPGGNPRRVLRAVRERWPVVLHGVSLAVGNTAPLDREYLKAVRALADEIEPALVSDHLCFGGTGGHYAHDLWPLPCTEESLDHVVDRVGQVQDLLGRRILLENPSAYVAFAVSTLPEWEFLAEVADRADCGILLDVNNVVVSAFNFGFSPADYLDALPADRIGQIHLAGHSDLGTHKLDTHDHEVPDEVWALYRDAIRRFGPVSTLVEWDDHVPSLERLCAEADRARSLM